ncbi:hypothetical protein F2B00_22195 [Streptomyces parvus]|uniref:hypothetical protein n=1 Tax=Streptomyces parvus TaxID=66428 RepID=UPI00123A799E|nr:hypothetical protein [Streptomyces parvus]KAA6200091.1 hypothetical protein F2B00_22195 [Streptomyces parvus]GGS41368.1 hypothetical protein GCM10010221_45200 [Streptomyces parvus]
MTTQPERLHHLLDRARRGVILPAEGEQLAGIVGEMEADLHSYEEVVVGDLNEANTGLQRQAARAEATVARVRQAVDAGPVGPCCAHLIHAALNPPTGLTAEEREAADAYAAKLNTPPSAATLAAIAERIADGTAPRRKVRRRAAIDSPSDTAQQHEAT